MSSRFVLAQQVLFKNGKFAGGAQAYFYEPGTTTPKAVYQDAELTAPHTNPVVADADGYLPTIYLDGVYKYRILDSKGGLIDEEDNYSGAADLTDLASPSGAAMVGRGAMTVGSVADLVALPEGLRKADLGYLVAGYHNGVTMGGGLFMWDGAQPKSEHDGGVIIDPNQPIPADWTDLSQVSAWFTPANSGSGCFVRVVTGDIYMENYGLSETTKQAATLMFKNGIMAANINKCGLRVVRKYKGIILNGPLEIQGVDWLDVDLADSSVKINGLSTGEVGISISNISTVLQATLVDSADVGDTTIQLDSTHGVEPEDILVLESEKIYNPQRPTDYRLTNIFRVESVSGNTVTLDESVYDEFDAATYAVTARFIRPVYGPGIRNARFIGAGVAQTRGVSVMGPISIDISNVGVYGFKSAGFTLMRGYNSGFTKCRVTGANDSTLGYGLYLFDVKHGYIKRSRGYENRHSFEAGGACEDCDIKYCKAEGDISYGAASHGNTRRISFIQNRIIRCDGGIDSRGVAAKIIGNTIKCSGTQIMVGEAGNPDRIGLAGVDLTVSKNNIESDGATLGVYINTTLRHARITETIMKGLFSSTGVLINGECCDDVLIGDMDMREAIFPNNINGLLIDVVKGDKTDLTLQSIKQRGGRNGIDIREKGTGRVSVVKMFDIDCQSNDRGPFEISGTFDVLMVGGAVLGGGYQGAVVPSSANVTRYLEYGVLGSITPT